MSCPHSTAIGSTPENCSQCLMAKARPVTYDADTRQMFVDGAPIVRPVEGEDRSPPNKGTKARDNGRRQKTCSLCGIAGHMRTTCHRQPAPAPGTEAMVRMDLGDEDR